MSCDDGLTEESGLRELSLQRRDCASGRSAVEVEVRRRGPDFNLDDGGGCLYHCPAPDRGMHRLRRTEPEHVRIGLRDRVASIDDERRR